jgi:hypothetical protein
LSSYGKSPRAGKLTSLSESIRQQKEELKLTEFYQEYSKAALYKLPKLSKGSVEYAVKWKPVATFSKTFWQYDEIRDDDSECHRSV